MFTVMTHIIKKYLCSSETYSYVSIYYDLFVVLIMKQLNANNIENLFSYNFLKIETHYVSLHLKVLE